MEMQVPALPFKVYPVPESWSLAEAATVPVAYSTAYFALIMRGGLQKGQSVLIHSGAGAVGLAAIRICLFRGCEVCIFLEQYCSDVRFYATNSLTTQLSGHMFPSIAVWTGVIMIPEFSSMCWSCGKGGLALRVESKVHYLHAAWVQDRMLDDSA